MCVCVCYGCHELTRAWVGVPPPPAAHGLGVCIWMHLVNGTGNSPSPGWPTPGVVKQEKSSRSSACIPVGACGGSAKSPTCPARGKRMPPRLGPLPRDHTSHPCSLGVPGPRGSRDGWGGGWGGGTACGVVCVGAGGGAPHLQVGARWACAATPPSDPGGGGGWPDGCLWGGVGAGDEGPRAARRRTLPLAGSPPLAKVEIPPAPYPPPPPRPASPQLRLPTAALMCSCRDGAGVFLRISASDCIKPIVHSLNGWCPQLVRI